MYRLQRALRGHLGDVYTCRFFPSGVVILTGSADMQLKIWSAEDGACAATMRGHSAGDVTHVVTPHVDFLHVLAANNVRSTKMACMCNKCQFVRFGTASLFVEREFSFVKFHIAC